jgi:hypothetical protein
MRHAMMRLAAAALLTIAGVSFAMAGDCAKCAPAVVQGVGTPTDCGDCGPKAKHSIIQKAKSSVACCDSKFMFGSSKSFFSTCNGGCSDLPISLNRANCPKPIYGSGIGTPANNCAVHTNLSR